MMMKKLTLIKPACVLALLSCVSAPVVQAAETEVPVLLASAGPPPMYALTTPPLIANSLIPPLVAGSVRPPLTATTVPPLISQSPGYISTAGREQIVPIARPAPTMSWFTYGYLRRYRASIHKTFLYMAPVRTGIRLRYEFQDEKRISGENERKSTYHKFAERIGFTTRGWIYHPDLVQYTFSLEPEFTQVYESRDEDTRRRNNFSPDFNLATTAFETKPYTLRFFAARNEVPEWTAFTGASETREEIIGGDAQLDFIDVIQNSVPGILHSNIGYQYSQTETDAFYPSSTEYHRVDFNSLQRSIRSNTQLNIKYYDQDFLRTNYSNTENIRNKTLDTLLTHYYYFTDQRRSNINSTLAYLNQDINGTSFESFRLSEAVSLYHRPKFRSRYILNYTKSKSDNRSDTDLVRAEASLNHTLYDNLFTFAGARSNYRNSESSEAVDFNPFLEFRYNRDIPWGTFSLLPGWDYRITHRNSNGSGRQSIIGNEIITLEYGADVRLIREDIDITTIVVSSRDLSRVYTVNVDYEVEQIGSEIIIRPLPFGDINDNESLVVRYQYSEDTTFDDSIFRQGYGIRFNLFKSLNMFYRYAQAKQDILSGPPPDRLRDTKIHTAEIRLDYKWSRTRVRYEDRDTGRGNATETMYLQQDIHFSPFRRSNFSITGTVGTTNYEANPDSTDYYGVSMTFNWRLVRWCSMNFSGWYQVNDSGATDSVNSGLRTGLNFQYRIWQARLYYQYLNQEYNQLVNDSKRERSLFRLDIIRLKW
jgi:hypothetical protein